MRYGLYFLITFLFLSSLWVIAEAQTCQSELGGYCTNIGLAQVSIPGLEGLPTARSIGELISKLYVWGVGLVALSAFIMFTVGGIAYLTAGDKEGQITKAKSFMKNAIFGLTLALLSWLILFTINPDLVKTLDLNLETIEIKGGGGTPASGTFGGANIGDKRVETGVGEVTVVDKLNNVDQCTREGQAQREQFCKNCLDKGGKLCKRSDDKPIGQCLQNYLCLK